MSKESSQSSELPSTDPLFSDEMVAKRFSGSPFAETYITLPHVSDNELSLTDRLSSMIAETYRPGYISGAIIVYGFFQKDLQTVGAGICSMMAEASFFNLSRAHLEDPSKA